LKGVVLLLVVYAAFLGGLLLAMFQPPETFGRIMSKVPGFAFVALPFKHLWLLARKGHLKVGDLAPDFYLETADKKTRLKLSSFKGERPVVLVFGSHT
jgi:hypothetical protein